MKFLVVAAIVYVVFGLVFHLRKRNLTLELMIDYILLALLSIIIIQDASI